MSTLFVAFEDFMLSREAVLRGARDRALVLTLIDNNIRRGKRLALTWERVDLHTGMIHVRRG